MIYRDITISTTIDKNLDSMGYKVWIPQAISGSIASGSVVVSEKFCMHFQTEAEARKYLDYCLDVNSDALATGTYENKLTTAAH